MTAPLKIDPRLMDYCETDRQRELIAAIIDEGGVRAASLRLGIGERSAFECLARIRKRAGMLGFCPEAVVNRPTIPGFGLTRVSTLARNEAGEPQWLIQQPDKIAQAEALASAIETATSAIKPCPVIKLSRQSQPNYDLLTVYTITDYHLGMYAWEDETGGNWDMDIAESLLMNKFAEMLAGSPDSEVGIFAQLGDLLHWDGLLALTPTAKNVLDADTRFPLLVESAIRCMIWCVELMLKKHPKVHVIMAEGNHDLASSVWLRAMMRNLFRKNERVTVETSPHPYYVYEWGYSMLAWHHGHLSKMESLPGIFASEPRFREMWGRAKYTFIHTGHRHHQKVIEKGGAITEQHPTLSQRDSHGSRLFEISQRAAKAITYHKDRGEYLRLTVTP